MISERDVMFHIIIFLSKCEVPFAEHPQEACLVVRYTTKEVAGCDLVLAPLAAWHEQQVEMKKAVATQQPPLP